MGTHVDRFLCGYPLASPPSVAGEHPNTWTTRALGSVHGCPRALHAHPTVDMQRGGGQGDGGGGL